MLSTVSLTIVFLCGFAVFAVGSWGVATPQSAFASINGMVRRPWGIPSAVVIRLVLGLALVLGASASRYPVFFQIFGWLTIAAALLVVFMGRERVEQLVARFGQSPEPVQQAGFLAGVVLGMMFVIGTF